MAQRCGVERRHAIARALGYVLRNPCSFCTSGYPRPCDGTHPHFNCYESADLEPRGYASVHSVHDHTSHHPLPGGLAAGKPRKNAVPDRPLDCDCSDCVPR